MRVSEVVNEDVVNFYNYLQIFHKDKKVSELTSDVLKAFNCKDELMKTIDEYKRISKDLGPFLEELKKAVDKVIEKHSKFMYIPYDDVPNIKNLLRYKEYTSTSNYLLSLFYLINYPDSKYLPYLQQTYDGHDGFYDWNLEVDEISNVSVPYPFESWEEAKKTVQMYLELDETFNPSSYRCRS